MSFSYNDLVSFEKEIKSLKRTYYILVEVKILKTVILNT